MRNLKISRRRWYRGKGSTRSKLYRSSDKTMCCLGFLARECGAKVADIKDSAMPTGLDGVDWPHLDRWSVYKELMLINDAPYLQAKEELREQKIHDLMLELGVEVTFVD